MGLGYRFGISVVLSYWGFYYLLFILKNLPLHFRRSMALFFVSGLLILVSLCYSGIEVLKGVSSRNMLIGRSALLPLCSLYFLLHYDFFF